MKTWINLRPFFVSSSQKGTKITPGWILVQHFENGLNGLISVLIHQNRAKFRHFLTNFEFLSFQPHNLICPKRLLRHMRVIGKLPHSLVCFLTGVCLENCAPCLIIQGVRLWKNKPRLPEINRLKIFRNIVKISLYDLADCSITSSLFVVILIKILPEIKIPMDIESQFFGKDNTAQKRR